MLGVDLNNERVIPPDSSLFSNKFGLPHLLWGWGQKCPSHLSAWSYCKRRAMDL